MGVTGQIGKRVTRARTYDGDYYIKSHYHFIALVVCIDDSVQYYRRIGNFRGDIFAEAEAI